MIWVIEFKGYKQSTQIYKMQLNWKSDGFPTKEY